MNTKTNAQPKGFTLIEVLLSVIILFASSVLVLTIFQSSATLSQKATSYLELVEDIPQIRRELTEAIRAEQGPSAKQGRFSLGTTEVDWTTELITSGSIAQLTATEQMQVASLDDPLNRTFYLWQVDFVVTNGARSKSYDFIELTWDPI